ncbi:MAG: bifunctional riboflavin kinase/FAD synthetase [Bacteroidales bacterium]|nr:bifunctional riboflavin kinase/FAD synthetase [Bacteroidales bacterium]
MKVYRDLSGEITPGTAATIGIFDGVHLAHKQIITRLKELSLEKGCESLLVTLWPHPRYVLNKDADSLKLLTTLDEKLCLLETAGLQNVLLIPFDAQFASTSFDKFIKRIIVDKLRARHLVVGFNHQFGRDRQGNFDSLKLLAEKNNIELEQMPKIMVGEQRVSSSVIRNQISTGEIVTANKLLGYEYILTGKIVHGNKVGRKLGFPTANIEVAELYKLIPADGVYAIEAIFGNTRLKGMLNIGTRPTIDNRGIKVIEANFFNFEGNLYNTFITIKFHKRIREEIKFESAEKLVEQIQNDKQTIINYFNTIK